MSMKKTKIICTIGPASESVDTLVELMNAGMNVCRLNFSHGDHEEQGNRIQNIRKAMEISGKRVALLLDTKGPEIRTHLMKDGKVEFSTGDIVRVSMTEVEGTREKFSVSYEGLINDVEPGMHIMLDDGLIDLLVQELDNANNEIVCEVQNEGILKNRKGVNVPNASIKLPALTEKDANDIRFGIEQGVDFIAASFVRRASDVLAIREILEENNGQHIQIIPKIENQEGIDNADEILAVSDGLMIARGDMGIEIPVENVPSVQKMLIKKCNELGKPVVTATQMLDSMQSNPRPTRAEVTDVANAIYDGTDAIMLSGETAAGDYPVITVQTMARIAERTEQAIAEMGINKFSLPGDKNDITEAIGRSVVHTAKNTGIETIVAATVSGYTARKISKYRPNAYIVALTFSEQKARSLALTWGVYPQVKEHPSNTDAMFALANEVAKESGFAKEGDTIIVTAGVGEQGTTNLMKIQEVE